MALGLVLSQVVTLVAFCTWKPWNGWNGTDSSTALRAFKKPNGYYRRPLRPSRFDDGPDKEGEGRGEWQGDEGKFTVNFGDPRLQRQAFQEEEEEAEDSSWEVEDSSWEVEEVPDFEEPPRQKRAPKRKRRMKTRSEVVNDKEDFFVKRREPWRPPVLRKREEGRPRREAPRREAPRGEALDEAQAQFKVPQLDPPVRPVNLERMAQQGLPIVNLYQLEPYDFYVYLIKELGIQRMHAKQIRQWLFTKGVQDFTQIDAIPFGLRESLGKLASAGAPDWKTLAERESLDGTVKVAYGLPDGHAIESVLMPYQDGRRTACISSQVGCAMGCVFCATGQMGFKRHLTSGEIFEQAARFSAKLQRQGLRLSSVVLLGMGEPLANFDNVVKAVHRIHDELGIGMRHITISTVGLVPEIKRLADEQLQVTLAISLHAANDEERSKLLPMNNRYPVASVMQAAKEYYEATKRRVSFEWTLIAGENDTPEKAQELGKLIYLNCPGAHVNLIPLNPTSGYGGGPSQREAVAKFVATLRQFGVEATVRVRRGIDIDAGCGQLAERALQEYNVSAPEALPAR